MPFISNEASWDKLKRFVNHTTRVTTLNLQSVVVFVCVCVCVCRFVCECACVRFFFSRTTGYEDRHANKRTTARRQGRSMYHHEDLIKRAAHAQSSTSTC